MKLPISLNFTATTDQAGNSILRGADGFGRLRWVKENSALPTATPSYYSTLYTYDPLDDLTGVTQSGQGRTFNYDSLKRLALALNPENGTIRYTYDNNGNLQTKTDARNNVTTYQVDRLNRVYSKTYTLANGTQPTNPVNYIYDLNATGAAIGHLISVSNETASSAPFNGSSTTYTNFDSLGRPGTSAQTTLGKSYTFQYAYNLAGSITAETLPSLRVINTSYDALNQSTSVSAGGKTYVSNVAYWPHGGIYSYQRHNGLSYGATYNSRLQLAEVDEAVPATPTNTFLWVSCPNWGLNNGSNGPYGVCPSLPRSSQNNGNLQAVSAYATNDSTPVVFGSLQGIKQTFLYDGLNRIASITDNGGGSSSRTFGYDAYGNMWIPTNNGLPIGANPAPPTAQGAFNQSNNQLLGATYDFSGNQQTFGTYTVAYDAESRQVSETTTGGGSPASYVYDGDGRRVQTTVGSVHTYYVYDAGGNLSAEYSDGPNSSACQTCYLSYDHLGSTRMVTDESKQVVERHDYLPFGEEIINGNAGRGVLWGMTTGLVNQKFTGKERDAESGLDYFGARYYGSALGRFTSPDWSAKPEPAPYADFSNPQTLNQYAYVLNNPLAHADADGHCDSKGLLCQAWTWLGSEHSAKASGTASWRQDTKTSGSLSITSKILTADASASASYGRNTGAAAKASASAISITAKEGEHSTTQIDSHKLSADAHTSFGVDGVSVGGGAHANVLSASQKETFTLGSFTITGTLAGEIGVGANAAFSLGGGSVSASAGIALGYGGSLSLGVSYNGSSEVSGGGSIKGDSTGQKANFDRPKVKELP